MSSNKALQIVKRILNAKKAGHTGSLDPLATGLLPICLGQATKVSEYLLNSHKKYSTVIKLGESTDTLDSEGEVIARSESRPSDDEVQDALEQFRGKVKQIPPMYSALKRDGQPLYKLARKGEEVERPARDMEVFDLSASRIDSDHLRLEVHCSSGFYIRSLADDLGKALGCGAHVVELRRIAIKEIGLDGSVSLSDFESSQEPKNHILPIDTLIAHMPIISISVEEANELKQGRQVQMVQAVETELSRIMVRENELFGIGKTDEKGVLRTNKMFVTD